jgi:hypothetical protein
MTHILKQGCCRFRIMIRLSNGFSLSVFSSDRQIAC